MFSITPAVRTLLLVNVLVYFVISSMSQAVQEGLVDQFALHSLVSQQFRVVQLITHMFMHGGFSHLFSNMLGLFFFGPMLERFWNARRFLTFYLLTGLGAAALYLAVNYYETASLVQAFEIYRANPTNGEFIGFINAQAPSLYDTVASFIQKFDEDPENPAYIEGGRKILTAYVATQVNTPMLGASGAIFGVLMAFGLLFPNTELRMLFFPVPIKAKYLIGAYAFWEIYTGVYRAQADGVAHFAHIGGMLFAYIIIKVWGSQRKTFY